MPKNENQKLKTLYILDILTECTDSENGLTMPELLQKLEERGVRAERKSVYDDIFLLRENYGADIELVKGGGRSEYRLMTRAFELPELKLLVDAVEASRFITRKKSDQLVAKLRTLAGNRSSRLLRGQVVVADRIKTMNESIYYNVDAINEAIHSDRMLSFVYFEYAAGGEKRLRRNGAPYNVTPCTLCWDNENYYLIAVEDGRIKHYRVDKMQSINILDTPREHTEAFDGFDAANYSRSVFGMYGGEEKTVTLSFSENLVSAVYDRFGQVRLQKTENGYKFTTSVRISPQFFGWISGFGGGIKIDSPPKLKSEFREFLQQILTEY